MQPLTLITLIQIAQGYAARPALPHEDPFIVACVAGCSVPLVRVPEFEKRVRYNRELRDYDVFLGQQMLGGAHTEAAGYAALDDVIASLVASAAVDSADAAAECAALATDGKR